MIVLAWNCRWLGNLETIHALGRLVSSKDPHVIFVCETRLSRRRAENLKRRYGMSSCIAVDSSSECTTRLMIMWKEEVQANLIAFSNIHIDVEISMGEEQFRFTGLHGFSDTRKSDTWFSMDRIRYMPALP
ncbi:hypothetical protein V6N13_129603 [Hibiscus sabdariffa]